MGEAPAEPPLRDPAARRGRQPAHAAPMAAVPALPP